MIYFFYLGEGTFGKVYTAVNVDTGELMAMKEVCIFLKIFLLMEDLQNRTK